MAPPDECDYLVVGGGATGLAFADSFLEHCDDRDLIGPPKVVVMDRRGSPGGQWNDGYSFVRLHQPSAGYGVETMRLEPDDDDGTHRTEGVDLALPFPSERSAVAPHRDVHHAGEDGYDTHDDDDDER